VLGSATFDWHYTIAVFNSTVCIPTLLLIIPLLVVILSYPTQGYNSATGNFETPSGTYLPRVNNNNNNNNNKIFLALPNNFGIILFV